MLDLIGLNLQKVVSYPTEMLGNKPGSSGREQAFLIPKPSFQSPYMVFIFGEYVTQTDLPSIYIGTLDLKKKKCPK